MRSDDATATAGVAVTVTSPRSTGCQRPPYGRIVRGPELQDDEGRELGQSPSHRMVGPATRNPDTTLKVTGGQKELPSCPLAV